MRTIKTNPSDKHIKLNVMHACPRGKETIVNKLNYRPIQLKL